MLYHKMEKKPVTEIKLRSYPKVIFFYPLLFTSLILWPLSLIANTELASWFGIVWLIVLFCNIFVMAFDFSSSKFFILILAIVIIILLGIFWLIPVYGMPDWSRLLAFEPGMTWQFYMTITIILVVVLALVILDAFFDYWKVERNEIYHKSGIFSTAERFPVKSLRWKKEIPDVFEFFVLRAGTITLMPGRVEETITLQTVLNVNKKAELLDYLLSHVSVEPDELDT